MNALLHKSSDTINVQTSRLIDVLGNYQTSKQWDSMNITSVMNDFLYTMATENFEDICNELNNKFKCELRICPVFRRNYRVRDDISYQNIYPNKAAKEAAISQTIDKIHCYYCHSIDTGLVLIENE